MKASIPRNVVVPSGFNPNPWFPPYELRSSIFQEAMQDVYDFFYDVNTTLLNRGLPRLDDMLRPAAMSGIISDMLTARIAAHSQTLTENRYFNGHPDLIVKGVYKNDARGELGTRTATLDAEGIKKLRARWLYRLPTDAGMSS